MSGFWRCLPAICVFVPLCASAQREAPKTQKKAEAAAAEKKAEGEAEAAQKHAEGEASAAEKKAEGETAAAEKRAEAEAAGVQEMVELAPRACAGLCLPVLVAPVVEKKAEGQAP